MFARDEEHFPTEWGAKEPQNPHLFGILQTYPCAPIGFIYIYMVYLPTFKGSMFSSRIFARCNFCCSLITMSRCFFNPQYVLFRNFISIICLQYILSIMYMIVLLTFHYGCIIFKMDGWLTILVNLYMQEIVFVHTIHWITDLLPPPTLPKFNMEPEICFFEKGTHFQHHLWV